MFIQTEETPNPATLKFMPGMILVKSGTLEFKDKNDAKQNPLARELFLLSGITGVFIGKDFVTITKSESVEWESIKPSILSSLQDILSSEVKIDIGQGIKDTNTTEEKYSKKDQEIVKKINELLEERIKPAVAQDGGDISFVKFSKGVVFLELKGACSGCPSSTITLKSGIENMLKYYIPEIDSVEAVSQ